MLFAGNHKIKIGQSLGLPPIHSLVESDDFLLIRGVLLHTFSFHRLHTPTSFNPQNKPLYTKGIIIRLFQGWDPFPDPGSTRSTFSQKAIKPLASGSEARWA